MNEATTDLLDRHDWSGSIIKLTAYAVSLCRFGKISLPKGLEAEDLVMEAIEKVYSGDRNWDYISEPDLHKFLLSIIKSILFNTINTVEGKLAGKINDFAIDFIPGIDDTESEIYSIQLDQAISVEMKGDPELCLVYKALKDGLSPNEIAEEYAVAVENVRNAKKRLIRLAYRVINILQKSTLE